MTAREQISDQEFLRHRGIGRLMG